MKALFLVTGRGEGGDAVTAYNISKALARNGFESDFALDHRATGLFFEKKGIKWYRTSIPQAGGHAATKMTLFKGGFKIIKAVFSTLVLLKKTRPKVLIGVIGGGAVIACTASKFTGIPTVGISNTPTDAKVCSNLTTTIALPESTLFSLQSEKNNVYKAYYPVDPKIVQGSLKRAIKMMPANFNADLPTILLSSGSLLFEKMALAASKLAESSINANIIVVGKIRNPDCEKLLESEDIIYLGYVDWMQDLLQLSDIAVLSDDGMMINEALACKIPIVSLIRVKYGRYHNIASLFQGAVVESNIDDISRIIVHVLNNLNQFKNKAALYGEEILKSSDRIAQIIMEQVKK
ncbi:MAG: hypothetical protein Kow0019_01150 [Methanobacteriaceae archaeon]